MNQALLRRLRAGLFCVLPHSHKVTQGQCAGMRIALGDELGYPADRRVKSPFSPATQANENSAGAMPRPLTRLPVPAHVQAPARGLVFQLVLRLRLLVVVLVTAGRHLVRALLVTEATGHRLV